VIVISEAPLLLTNTWISLPALGTEAKLNEADADNVAIIKLLLIGRSAIVVVAIELSVTIGLLLIDTALTSLVTGLFYPLS
jgi:hypothetical protein